MIRRRRPAREIPFSFDSFLDIVANVVGIIIRLILVVWVGARSYSSLQPATQPAADPAALAQMPEPAEPLQLELAQRRRELEKAQERLLEQLRQLQQTQTTQTAAEQELATLVSRRQDLERAKADAERGVVERGQTVRAAALSLADVRQRSQRLVEEIRTLEKLPPLTQTLRYRTPVSRPVQADELMFECRAGRVTFVDIGALLAEVKRGFEDKGKLLRHQWQVSDVAGPVGAFRLLYTVERERGLLDGLAGAGGPQAEGSYRYGLTSWEVQPLAPVRGEAGDAALADGSEFRQVIDGIDPQQTVVTLWVYPDSFALYRRLRDYLYDRDVVVAGRPLPEGHPIASSRQGTVSRGQ
jgi:hypothetical protein